MKCYDRRNTPQFVKPRQTVRKSPDDEGGAGAREEGSELAVLKIAQALDGTGGNARILKRITNVFLENVPPKVDDLERAIAAGRQEEAHRLSHSIRGAAAALGGMRVSDVACKMEQAAREKDLKLAGRLMQEMRAELARFKEALEATDWDTVAH